MGLPGPVHRPSGELGDSTILPGWVGVRAADAVSAALGHAVEVENDANLGALGEWMWGAGRGAAHMAYVKASTGIGAGFIVAGQPYVGAGGTAGELGHTVVDPGGPICRCGNRGCLETLAGAPAVLGSLRDVHGEALTLTEAVAYARRGDAGCQRAIADAGISIGTAVATLCNLFNPQRVVVGGDLGAAGELLLAPLRESLRRAAIRSAADDVEVVQGRLGERAEVLGAVALVLGRGVVVGAS
jgi:predicted NBD/HSP70 family sugar kinase